MRGSWQEIRNIMKGRTRSVIDRVWRGLFGLFCLASPAVAAEVNIHHEGGFGPGFSLHIDFEKRMMRYKAETVPRRPDEEEMTSELANHRNVAIYIKSLLGRIPDTPADQSDDSPFFRIEVAEAGKKIVRILEPVLVPSLDALIDGASSEEALEDATRFRKQADSILLLELIERLRYTYFRDASTARVAAIYKANEIERATLRTLNTTLVRDIAKAPDNPLGSAATLEWIFRNTTWPDDRRVGIHWMLPPSDWEPGAELWSPAEHADKPLRQLVNEVVQAEGWTYRIKDDFFLIQQNRGK